MRRPTRGASSRRACAASIALVVLVALALFGCASAPERKTVCDPHDLSGCIIEDVKITGNNTISSSDIEERLATAETSHIALGALEHVPLLSVLDDLTVEYERFDRFVLERDLARVERFYRVRGFYEASARAGRVIPLPNGRVRVEIVVEEGLPVRIERVELAWKDWRPTEDTREVTRAVTDIKNELRLGTHMDEERYDAVKKRLVRAMTERGFAYATATGKVTVDIAKHTADVVFTLELGPACKFGEVTIVGLRAIPEKPVRTAIAVTPGDPFSSAVLDAAEYALANFGVFGTIDIAPKRSPPGQPPDPIIPVTFTLTEGELHAISFGIGAELGSRLEGHVDGGWENRNFLGGLRRLSIQARLGLVFWPNQIQNLFQSVDHVLPELRLSFDFKQPGFIEPRTTFSLSGAFYLYCPLINCLPSKSADNKVDTTEPLVGYRQYSGRTGLDRPFLSGQYTLGQYINLVLYDPFSYNQGSLPPGYSRVLIPYLQTTVALDFRKGTSGKPDKLNPHSGVYLSTDAQFAFGSDAQDFLIRPELRAFIPVSRKATLAFRLTTGLLFPIAKTYGFELSNPVAPSDIADVVTQKAAITADARDLQVVRLRGLFSGGQNSNRGYGYQEIAPSAPLNLIYPFTQAQANARQAEGVNAPPILQAPVGGFTLWESSLELRLPIGNKFGTAIFTDASDVTAQVSQLRLTHPHVSAGLGLRYETPVGPLRFDVGYRIPGLQVLGTTTVTPCSANCRGVVTDEQTPSTVWGLPIALALTIGEAF